MIPTYKDDGDENPTIAAGRLTPLFRPDFRCFEIVNYY
jgi:hypothetical protein